MNIVIREIKNEEFKKFVEASPQFSFWQTKAMGDRRKLDNWDYELLGFYDKEQLLGAGLFYKRKLLNRYVYECMNGPIIDYSNPKPFFTALAKYLEKNKAYSCQINPNLTAYEHNIESDSKVEKNDYQKAKAAITESGFVFMENTDADDNLVNWFYKKDLSAFATPEELLKSFESETRRLINNSLKMHLVFEELAESEFDRLKNLVDMTATNKDFSTRSLTYYKSLYKEFNKENEVKMAIVKLDVKAYNEDLFIQKADLEAKILEDKEKNTKRSLNRMVQSQDVLRAVDNKLAIIDHVKDDYLDLCAGVFLFTHNTVTYLIGGSNNQYFSFNGPQFMQWNIMQMALAKQISTYDFYATRGSYIDRPEEDGVYYFKKGFSGQLYENFGYYHYQGNSLSDKLITLIKKIR